MLVSFIELLHLNCIYLNEFISHCCYSQVLDSM